MLSLVRKGLRAHHLVFRGCNFRALNGWKHDCLFWIEESCGGYVFFLLIALDELSWCIQICTIVHIFDNKIINITSFWSLIIVEIVTENCCLYPYWNRIFTILEYRYFSSFYAEHTRTKMGENCKYKLQHITAMHPFRRGELQVHGMKVDRYI